MSHSRSAPPPWLAATGAATGAAAGVSVFGSFSGLTVAFAPASTLINTAPSLTRELSWISTSLTVPATVEGTSMVALSDSSVAMASSTLMLSPTLTNRSMTGTSEKSPISGTLTSMIWLIVVSSRLNRHRIRLGRIQVVLDQRCSNLLALDLAFVSQRLQGSQGDPVAIDLEVVAQLLAGVGTTETVGAQSDVGVLDERTDLLGEQLDVVGRGNHRAFGTGQLLLDVRQLRRFERMQQVPAGDVLAIAGQFVEARATPEVGLDAPVVAEQVGGGDHFAEDGAGAEQLDARALRFGALPEGIHALDDVGFRAHRHFRMLVVLVHHGDVVEDVFLLLVHPAHAVLDDDRDFVLEGRVIGDAVGHQVGQDQAVAVLVLQAFAVQRRAAGGAADQEAAGALVAGCPDEVHRALQAEHRVADVERHGLHVMHGIRGGGGDPVAHRTGFVDAFLQHLAGLRFLVEHQLVMVFRHVVLAFLAPDTDRAEHAFHAEGARFVRHDGDDVLADVLVLQQHVHDADDGHRRGQLAAFAGGLQQSGVGFQRRDRQRVGLAAAGRQETAEIHPALAQVLVFRRVFGELQVGQLFQLVVRHRQAETVAEAADLLLVHLLLLVRDVHRLASLAHAEALDGLGQDQGRGALVLDGAVVGGEDLEQVVAAAVQRPDFIVGPVGDQFLQFRRVEEMLADIGAVLGLEGLVLAVDAFHHAALQDALLVAGEQRIPMGAPDQLDDVPAGTAELAFEFLDDLAVAAHRAVQALQVAVDHEDQVVQLLAAGHADGAQRFDFVGLAVAEEGPDLAITGLGQSARVEVLHEAGLVDGLDRAEAHRYGRELPEIRHQPRVRVGGNALAAGFLTEAVHLLFAEAAQHEGTGVDAGHRVALEEDQVAVMVGGGGVPEMREADVIEGGGGGEGGDVAADVGVLVGADDHGHCVPADVGVNLDFHVGIARVLGLLLDRNGVDVLGIGRVGDVHAI